MEKMGNAPDWEAVTIAGFHAMGLAESGEAAACWIRAVELLPPSISSDPRHAAGHSNVGVGHLLLGRRVAADAAFRAAVQCWTLLADRIPALEVPLVGTSSAFHFRLASESFASFTDARRKRYARLAEAGLEMTRFNALFARLTPPSVASIETAKGALTPLLADILGPRAPEIGLLAATRDTERTTAYADKMSDFKTRRPSLSEALSEDCHRLEMAFALTALFAPGLQIEDSVPHGNPRKAKT